VACVNPHAGHWLEHYFHYFLSLQQVSCRTTKNEAIKTLARLLCCCCLQTVTSAVKAPVFLAKSDSSITRGTKPSGGLIGTPAGWLFGGAKQKQQNLAKSKAFGRLANVDLAAARAPPAQPLRIVVAGFTADEAASELLPHFLDFAPANRCASVVQRLVPGVGRDGGTRSGSSASRPAMRAVYANPV
jgi:hypothetical protein